MKSTPLKNSVMIYNKKFQKYTEGKFTAYYNVEYYKYSEELGKQKYICHIILLSPLKVANFRTTFELQKNIIKEYLDQNSKLKINIDNTIFYTILELRKGLKFIGDLNMYKFVIEDKKQKEVFLNVTLGQIVVIMNPEIPSKQVQVLDLVETYLPQGKAYAIAINYDQAIKFIDGFNELIDDSEIDNILQKA